MAHLLNAQNNKDHDRRFEQLGTALPTPNAFRTASGAPGYKYWQQQADYLIHVDIDDENQRLTGREKITYINRSPEPLSYLWLQLDENNKRHDTDSKKASASSLKNAVKTNRQGEKSANIRALSRHLPRTNNLGTRITKVTGANGSMLKYTVVNTMMRIDLPEPLLPGAEYSFNISWWQNISDRMKSWSRGGYEYFPKEGNYLYTITQWFPRMCVYDDANGWQHKQFYGGGEFALTFGNYEVHITVPSDHVIAATGELQNAREVLSEKHYALFQKAKKSYDKPVVIISQDEAMKKEKLKTKDKKTWIYKAENVRDFAFGTSRKFIWDAMAVKIGDRDVMAMSYYPKEANPLYEKYSTEVVAHTLKTYSKYSLNYPYPVAISVAARNGMEYPMICFNYGRPNPDGTYSESLKYGMISVVIHEVGHNFFPMIINSDERQWAWMDEGLDTFLQFLTEQEWENNYPSRKGPPHLIVNYMKGDRKGMNPIMTGADNVKQYGNNAYGKPATALTILRETVMGRELFDYAFREYARRWAFRHPKPQDFFRTMEDASGMDLDWFWKGWFFSTEPVDIEISNVTEFKAFSSPQEETAQKKAAYERNNEILSAARNKEEGYVFAANRKPGLKDRHSNRKKLFKPSKSQIDRYKELKNSLADDEKEILNGEVHFYQVDFKNNGIIMPIILQLNYEDGTEEIIRIPAEIWRRSNTNVSKVFARKKAVKSFLLDPLRETADIDESNNRFPPAYQPTRFELYKSGIKKSKSSGKKKKKKNS